MSLRGVFTPKDLLAFKHGTNMNRGKSLKQILKMTTFSLNVQSGEVSFTGNIYNVSVDYDAIDKTEILYVNV